jgi:hypothetical protein
VYDQDTKDLKLEANNGHNVLLGSQICSFRSVVQRWLSKIVYILDTLNSYYRYIFMIVLVLTLYSLFLRFNFPLYSSPYLTLVLHSRQSQHTAEHCRMEYFFPLRINYYTQENVTPKSEQHWSCLWSLKFVNVSETSFGAVFNKGCL